MPRILGVAAMLGLLIFISIQEAHAVSILGQGSDTCAVWLKARSGPKRKEHQEWFLGYLSASAYLKNDNILKGMSYDDVLSGVRRSCEKDTTQRLDNVMDDFFR